MTDNFTSSSEVEIQDICLHISGKEHLQQGHIIQTIN